MTGFDIERNAFEAENTTIIANTAGFAFAASAMLIASGTITTVAPTFDMTCVKKLVRIATATSSPQIGTPSSTSSVARAIQAAAPLESTAQPSGIRQAIRKIVRQPIAA